ncbi:MAG: TetR/AcrR family transcriptional regulator [Pseudomonadota bacterium]
MAIGRPRAFDTEEALGKALVVFLRKGYEGSSIVDLTEAMGINPPSLYAAFGSKEDLFRKALDRYVGIRKDFSREALEAPTAREVVERLLRGTADQLTDPQSPPGCLLVQGALSCGESAEPIKKELCFRRVAEEVALRHRLERALASGDLPKNANAASLARYIATVSQGMAVQAAGTATRADLHAVVDAVMQAWPR